MEEPASSPLRLRVLGGFQLTGADGADLSPPGKKLRALVALLALAPPSGWSRDRLTAVLWGDREDEQARGSLRQALAELRRSLGESALQTGRDTVAFNPGAIRVDTHEFIELAAAGEAAKADALYNGDLLDGVSLPDAQFADWLLVERTRLHDIEVRVLGRLLASQSGEPVAATAQRLLHLEPANEEAHRALMRHYASTGDRAHALRQYQICRDALRRDLDVKPEAATEQLLRELQLSVLNGVSTPQPVDRSPGLGVDQVDERPPSVAEPDAVYRAALGIASRASAARRRRAALWIVAVPILALILVIGVPLVREALFPAAVLDEGIPIIVVLPFKDLTGSQSNADAIDYDKISAGITDNFTADLSTFPELQVVSSASAGAYAGRSIPEIAEATGASFVVQGSIRHVSNRATATVELIDARKDIYSMVVRVTAPVADPVALQSQMAATIRDQIAGMTGAFRKELERISWSHEGSNVTEYDYYIRGHSFSLREPNDWPHAYEQWSEGLERHPDSVLLRCKLMIYYLYSQSDAKHAQVLFDEMATLNKKSRLDEWYYLWAAARLHSELGDHKKAVEEARAARALAPYDTLSHNNLAWILFRAQLYDEALEWFKFAATDPHPKRWYFDDLVEAFGITGKWSEAVDFALEQIDKNPPALKYWYDFLGTAYSRTGQYDKAQEAWKKARLTPAPTELN